MDTDVTVLPLMPVKSGNLEQAAVHMLFFFNRETFSQVVSLEKTHPAEAGRCRGILAFPLAYFRFAKYLLSSHQNLSGVIMANPYQAPVEASQPTMASNGKPTLTYQELLWVSRGQRMVIAGVLGAIGCNVLSFAIDINYAAEYEQYPILGLVQIVVLLLLLISILAAMVGSWLCNKTQPLISRLLLSLSIFVPFIGLLCMLVSSSNASHILKAHGYKVGFFGAKMR